MIAAREISQRVFSFIKEAESEYKERDRFERYPRRIPLKDAINGVLKYEDLDAFTAELLIKELGRADGKLALALLDMLIELKRPCMSKTVFDATISVCCISFLPKEALRVYALMVQLGLLPDVQTCNLVITACSQSGDVPGVLQVIADMKAKGITLNDFTLPIALQACLFKRKGNYQEAVKIYETLQSLPGGQMASPSVEAADILLSVCEAAMDKAGNLLEATAAFEALKGLGGLHACTRAFNGMLRACARRGAWKEARHYFDEMAQVHVPHDTESFTYLIKACLAGGALKHALEIFEWMASGHRVTDPMPANIETFNTLIKACHQSGQLEKALEIMMWVQCSGMKFNDTTYEELIAATEIVEMWDTKAVREASQSALAVFPQHLRPARYDATRLSYLEHVMEQGDQSTTRGKAHSVGSASPLLVPPAGAVAPPLFLGGSSGATPRDPLLAASQLPKVKGPILPLILSRAPSMKSISLDNINRSAAATMMGQATDGAFPRTAAMGQEHSESGTTLQAFRDAALQYPVDMQWPASPSRPPGPYDNQGDSPFSGSPLGTSRGAAPLPVLGSPSSRPWPNNNTALSRGSKSPSGASGGSPHGGLGFSSNGRIPSPQSRLGSRVS